MPSWSLDPSMASCFWICQAIFLVPGLIFAIVGVVVTKTTIHDYRVDRRYGPSAGKLVVGLGVALGCLVISGGFLQFSVRMFIRVIEF